MPPTTISATMNPAAAFRLVMILRFITLLGASGEITLVRFYAHPARHVGAEEVAIHEGDVFELDAFGADSLAFTDVGAASEDFLVGLQSVVPRSDYLGEGHDQFLIENTSGVVDIGDWTGGAIHYTQVGGLGSEWAFH